MERASKEVNKKIQEKLLKECKNKVIVWNGKRGEGKTDFIIKKAVHSKERNFLIVVSNNNVRKHLNEIIMNYISPIKNSFIHGKITVVGSTYTFYYEGISKKIEVLGYMDIYNKGFDIGTYDCILVDEIMYMDMDKLNIKKLNEVCNKLYILGTMPDVEFIDTYNADDNIDVENFYDKQINELKKEFATIDKTSKTVMTRKDILNQIDMLLKMKRLEGDM